MANKLALETGIGCRLLLKHPAIVWLVRRVAWLITRYNTGRDGCSPSRRIFGKSYNVGICKFWRASALQAEQVIPRVASNRDGSWELGLAKQS